MAPKFYLAKEGRDLTRIDLAELKQMIVNRTITGDDLIYAKHLIGWTKARHVKGFRTLIARMEAGKDDTEGDAARILHASESTSDLKTGPTSSDAPTDLPKTSTESNSGCLPKRPISFVMASESIAHSPKPNNTDIQQRLSLKTIVASLLLLFLVIGTYALWPSSGPSRSNVSGTVKYMGQPIEAGKISFESPDATAPGATGEIINGHYELNGAVAPGSGTMIVRFWAVRKTGKKLDPKKFGPGMEHMKGDFDEQEMYIPDLHNAASKHKVQISSGKTNVFDFDLEGAPKKK